MAKISRSFAERSKKSDKSGFKFEEVLLRKVSYEIIFQII